MPFGSQAQLRDVLDEMVHWNYLVETPDGTVGMLDGCERDENGRPMTMVVAQGWLGRRRLEIPVEQVVEIDHYHRRIFLARGGAPVERKGLIQRLVERGQRPSGDDAAGSRPGAQGDRPVICGIDHDAHAAEVLSAAAHLARLLDVPLVVTHVVPSAASAAPGERGDAELAKRMLISLDGLLSRVVTGSHVRRIVLHGGPARKLVELASRENAAFVVIGAGDGGAAPALTANVSPQVIHSAPCPVVVVPRPLRSGLAADLSLGVPHGDRELADALG